METEKPRVSIGMPVFNGERFLEEALDSLLTQTHEGFELIISDNASTDQTQEICTTYAARDRRIRYCRVEQNRGVAWNFNNAFQLSTGEYFKWAAHDDYCAPEFIERCVEALDRMPEVVVCYPQAILIDERGTHLSDCRDECHLDSPRASHRFRHLLMNLRLSNPIFGVIRANALGSAAPFGSYVASDIILLSELALRGKLYQIPERLFFRRDHPDKSNRANPTVEELSVFYDPANRGKVPMREWRLVIESVAAIGRAPITVREKSSCYMYMIKRLKWNRKALGSELLRFVKRIPRRPKV
jgi:glycosyltransferase involved in cell wall biosynthesis